MIWETRNLRRSTRYAAGHLKWLEARLCSLPRVCTWTLSYLLYMSVMRFWEIVLRDFIRLMCKHCTLYIIVAQTVCIQIVPVHRPTGQPGIVQMTVWPVSYRFNVIWSATRNQYSQSLMRSATWSYRVRPQNKSAATLRRNWTQ